jgi:hypothetical protein
VFLVFLSNRFLFSFQIVRLSLCCCILFQADKTAAQYLENNGYGQGPNAGELWVAFVIVEVLSGDYLRGIPQQEVEK